jgi:hypothetical protein
MKKIRLHRRLPRAQTSDFEIFHRIHYFLKSPQDKINRREARSLDCLGPARNLILSSTTESKFPRQTSILKVIDKSTLVYAPLQINDLPFQSLLWHLLYRPCVYRSSMSVFNLISPKREVNQDTQKANLAQC